MIGKESLFNIPFWKIQTINFEEKKKKLVELLEFYPEEEKGGMQEFATNKQSNRSGLVEQFSSNMNEELMIFSKEIKRDFAITDIWSISYNKGDYQSSHNHGSEGLSGILYLDLPKDSPETVYIQPWNDYVTDTVSLGTIPVDEGDIVIVPSFVLHFSKPNKSEEIKRIISWDMKLILEERSSIN